ncbi:MAG: hypothetical protein AAGK22_06790 [Acidobacteriota bacterium]
MSDEAFRSLEAGRIDRAESQLREALEAARREVRRDLEIRLACALGELMVTTGQSSVGAELFAHTLELIDGFPAASREDFGSQRRISRRYLDELQPLDDPEIVEWGD